MATVIAGELGLRPTATELATADPELLVAAADTVMAAMPSRWGRAALRSILFSPVVDGDVLPATPWQALAGGVARDIDLIAGHTRDEQRLFTVMAGGPGDPDEALRDFAPGPDGERHYREAFPDGDLYELVHSDWLFRMPSLHLAEAQVAGGGRAHVYELTWPAPGMGGVFGACHGLDVPLVFGNLDRGGPAVLIGPDPSPEAEALSAEMRTAWTTFATHGDPGWPAYETEKRLTQIFDAPSAVTAYPEEASRLIWRDVNWCDPL
ncbi:carboxylesterase family protein [Paractinoplanes durhamensis]